MHLYPPHHTHAHTHTHTHTNMSMSPCTRTHTLMHARSHTHVLTCTHTQSPENKVRQTIPIYRGFPTRMVYLYYISCLRYTILVGNPRYMGMVCLMVPDQNGASLLYIMLEIHHSGREPSICVPWTGSTFFYNYKSSKQANKLTSHFIREAKYHNNNKEEEEESNNNNVFVVIIIITIISPSK